MKLGGRIGAAIEILTDIETRHRPAGETLKDWGISHRFAGSGDRAAIGNIVYDTLRWRASSAWIMGEDSARGAVLAMMARRWGLAASGVAAALAEDAHAANALSPAEADRIETAELTSAPGNVRADVPEWTVAPLARLFETDWVMEGEALAVRPPLDMRVNTLKADRLKVLKTLVKFDAGETPFAPGGLRIGPTSGDQRHPNVEAEPAFQKGWFEVQDEGSQIAAALTNARPGLQVLDLCAGAGGKTLALAAAMAKKGRLIATDSDRVRLAPIFDRVKRAGAHNVEVRAARASLDDLVERMDVVLVDAPCTGTGTWRRRPDAKWRVTERALAARQAEQSAILGDAARYAKSGGRVVYVTCSLLPQENEDQITAFAAAHPEYEIMSPADVVAAADVGSGLAEAALVRPNGLVLSPHRTGTDGFFVAVLRRR